MIFIARLTMLLLTYLFLSIGMQVGSEAAVIMGYLLTAAHIGILFIEYLIAKLNQLIKE